MLYVEGGQNERGQLIFDAMCSLLQEFMSYPLRVSLLGVSLRVTQNSFYFIVILLPKYSMFIGYGHVSLCDVF